MRINELKNQLKALQEELTNLRATEDHTKEKIEAVLLEITQELEERAEQQSSDEHNSGLQLKSLSESLHRFEAQHPELTDSINRVFIALSNMGI